MIESNHLWACYTGQIKAVRSIHWRKEKKGGEIRPEQPETTHGLKAIKDMHESGYSPKTHVPAARIKARDAPITCADEVYMQHSNLKVGPIN